MPIHLYLTNAVKRRVVIAISVFVTALVAQLGIGAGPVTSKTAVAAVVAGVAAVAHWAASQVTSMAPPAVLPAPPVVAAAQPGGTTDTRQAAK